MTQHDATLPFWKTKKLAEMTPDEWESLCDGCGRCCLQKFEDEDTGEVFESRVACRLLDLQSCRCSNYLNRQKVVPDCLILTPQKTEEIDWLPPTCAYRLLARGEDLAWWHPLVSGNSETVHQADISIQNAPIVSEDDVSLEDIEWFFEDFLLYWKE